MDVEPKYTFVTVPEKVYQGLGDKTVKQLIEKW